MKFSTLRDLGTGFLGFLFCLSLSVVLILNFRPLYVYEMKSENLASVSSMTEAEILEEYDALIRYNSLFYRGELTFPSLPMSEEGRIHFEEVKRIFDGIQILLILSALTFLPLAVFRIRKKQIRLSQGHSRNFRDRGAFWLFLSPSLTGTLFSPLSIS